MVEEEIQKKIHEVLENVLEEKLPEISLSLKSMEELENKIWECIKTQQEINENRISKMVKSELKKALVATIIKSPTNKIGYIIMDPLNKIYKALNNEYNLKDDQENYQIFVNITIFLMINTKKEYLTNCIKQWYKREVFMRQKKKEKNEPKENIENFNEKSSNEPSLIEHEFEGDKGILYMCLQTLPDDEKEYIKNIKSELEIKNRTKYNSIIIKLKQVSRCYFLLKMDYQSSREIIEELRNIQREKNVLHEITRLQEKYFRRTDLSREEIVQEINKLKDKDERKYRMLQIFLGSQYDNGKFHVSEIIKNANEFIRLCLDNKKRKISQNITTQIFKGNALMQKNCIESLDSKMQDYIHNIVYEQNIEENEYYNYTMTKLKEATCLYFLIKWKYETNERIIEELKKALSQKNYLMALKALQQDFYATKGYSYQEGNLKVRNQNEKSKEEYDALKVFLGKKYYNGEDPEIIMMAGQIFLDTLPDKAVKKQREPEINSHEILKEFQKYPELYAFIIQNPEINIQKINQLFLNREKDNEAGSRYALASHKLSRLKID